MHRFYIAPSNWNPQALMLEAEEAHHATDVLRLAAGDRVVVFNGHGVEACAEIVSLEKKAIRLNAISVQKSEPQPVRITLGQAVPKGKNMELIIEKATELGAARVVPILSERTVVRLDAEEALKKQEKWQRVAVEACKQCGQNWLPEVTAPLAMDKFFAQLPRMNLMIIAAIEPEARRLQSILAELSNKPLEVVILIGPEGDFTPSELGLAKSHGCEPMSLGPIILRTETAAIYSLSVLAHELF